MKALVAYYSRTGKTRTAAMQVSEILGCGSEEIRDTARRSGLLGYLRSGLEGAMRRKARIKKVSLDPRSYDLLIVATPLWAGKISSPVRSYLSLFPRGLPPVALLCTGDDAPRKAAVKGQWRAAGPVVGIAARLGSREPRSKQAPATEVAGACEGSRDEDEGRGRPAFAKASAGRRRRVTCPATWR